MLHSPAQLAASALIGSFGYVFFLIVYRLTLHPLAKYPGPFLAKITSHYDAYQSWSGHRHQDQFRCQQKYGNVFRYGPNFLVIQTPEALQELYLHAKQRPVRKADNYYMSYDRGTTSTAFTVNKDHHAFQRRVMSYGFSEHALKAQEHLMIEQIDKWITMLSSGSSAANDGWSSPKNMAIYANYMTLDVLANLCFGKAFGLMDGKYRDVLPDVIFARIEQLHWFGNTSKPKLFKWLQEKTPLERIIFPRTAHLFKTFLTFIRGAINDREAQQAALAVKGQPPRQDFAHWLLEAKDPVTGKGYSPPQLSAELRVLIGAGSDTTSTAIAACLWYLTRYSKVLERLQNEIRSTFSDANDIITGPKLNGCHYLKAVVEETLRLAPPIPSALKRHTMAPITVGELSLPAGIDVGTSAWGVHHSDEHFPEATKFMPERWLSGTTPKDQLEHMKAMFTPFSQGNRACLGKNMAYNELTVALGKLFWTYDVRLAAGDTTGTDKDGFYELIDCFISRKDGPLVEFRKRDSI